MINYKYRLVNPTFRKSVNLTCYENIISVTISNILPSARNIMVHENNYSFDLRTKASRKQLIQLGRALAKAHCDFFDYMKIVTYKITKISRQLFRRYK